MNDERRIDLFESFCLGFMGCFLLFIYDGWELLVLYFAIVALFVGHEVMKYRDEKSSSMEVDDWS